MPARLITDGDRKFILEQLQNAPDNVLVSAYNLWAKERQEALLARSIINQETGREAAVPVSQPETRRNLNPGVSTITKIGAATRLQIMNTLADGHQPSSKYEEHLKLLWERGEVKFDGKEWWV